jgi:hypothetical protein
MSDASCGGMAARGAAHRAGRSGALQPDGTEHTRASYLRANTLLEDYHGTRTSSLAHWHSAANYSADLALRRTALTCPHTAPSKRSSPVFLRPPGGYANPLGPFTHSGKGLKLRLRAMQKAVAQHGNRNVDMAGRALLA